MQLLGDILCLLADGLDLFWIASSPKRLLWSIVAMVAITLILTALLR